MECAGEEIENTILSFIKKRKLETPAVFFLETMKPLSFLGSQMLLIASPFLSAIFPVKNINSYSEYLSDRKNVEKLIRDIEKG